MVHARAICKSGLYRRYWYSPGWPHQKTQGIPHCRLLTLHLVTRISSRIRKLSRLRSNLYLLLMEAGYEVLYQWSMVGTHPPAPTTTCVVCLKCLLFMLALCLCRCQWRTPGKTGASSTDFYSNNKAIIAKPAHHEALWGFMVRWRSLPRTQLDWWTEVGGSFLRAGRDGWCRLSSLRCVPAAGGIGYRLWGAHWTAHLLDEQKYIYETNRLTARKLIIVIKATKALNLLGIKENFYNLNISF